MKKQFHFRISPFFFFTAFLIALMSSVNFTETVIWVGAIFLSIFVHEMGHALVAYSFDQSVIIQFTAFGGATIPLGPKLKPLKEFIMVLMGPLFGFSLFAIASFALSKPSLLNPHLIIFFESLRFINLFWTILNLFPILPLDGGQLLRIGLESAFGIKGRRFALIFGGCLSLLIAFALMLVKAIVPAIFCFFFAFQNLELYKQMKLISKEDEEEPIKEELKEAMNLSKMQDHHANEKLEEVRKHSGNGLVFVIASQELAENYFEKKEYQKAFEILEPIEDKLMDTGKKLLLKSAFEIEKDEVVLTLAGTMLVSSPDQEIILMALSSAARKKDLEASLGWLQTALDFGCKELKSQLDKPYFLEIKKEPEFLEAIKEINQ